MDNILLNQEKHLPQDGVDPEKEDRVMLIRQWVSRIFYKQKFFDYPVKMKFQAIKMQDLKACRKLLLVTLHP